MRISKLAAAAGLTLQTPGANTDNEIRDGICCDLLSWVMAKGNAGMAWVTVQTHMNVVAVAALHEFSCIVLAEGCAMPQDVLAKAAEEGIAVLSSSHSAYELCGLFYELGIGK